MVFASHAMTIDDNGASLALPACSISLDKARSAAVIATVLAGWWKGVYPIFRRQRRPWLGQGGAGGQVGHHHARHHQQQAGHAGGAHRLVRQLLRPANFDPSAERRVFRLSMSDYGAAVLLPALLPLLRTEAPQVDLVVSQASREAMTAQVRDGETDLAFGVFPQVPDALVSQRLFEEEFVCVADRASLDGGAALGMAAWLARPHVLLSLWADSGNEVDLALAQLGETRRVCLTLPHWGVAPALVEGTDLVLTVARRIVPSGGLDAALAVFAPPFAIAPFAFCQLWHRRREDDPAHRWLRERIAALAGGPDQPPMRKVSAVSE